MDGTHATESDFTQNHIYEVQYILASWYIVSGQGAGAGTITGVSAGTGLSGGGVSGGVTLNVASLGITNGLIADDTISEAKLDIFNAPVNTFVLGYDQANGMTWVAQTGSGGGGGGAAGAPLVVAQPDLSVVANRTHTQEHGLGEAPELVRVSATANVADRGYAVGDVVDLTGVADGIAVQYDATNVYLYLSTIGINLTHKDGESLLAASDDPVLLWEEGAGNTARLTQSGTTNLDLISGLAFSQFQTLAAWVDNGAGTQGYFLWIERSLFANVFNTNNSGSGWVGYSDTNWIGLKYLDDTTFRKAFGDMGIRKLYGIADGETPRINPANWTFTVTPYTLTGGGTGVDTGNQRSFLVPTTSVTGTADDIILTTGSAINLQDGDEFYFTPIAANTGPVTIAIDGNPAGNLVHYRNDGLRVLSADDVRTSPMIAAYQTNPPGGADPRFLWRPVGGSTASYHEVGVGSGDLVELGAQGIIDP